MIEIYSVSEITNIEVSRFLLIGVQNDVLNISWLAYCKLKEPFILCCFVRDN